MENKISVGSILYDSIMVGSIPYDSKITLTSDLMLKSKK